MPVELRVSPGLRIAPSPWSLAWPPLTEEFFALTYLGFLQLLHAPHYLPFFLCPL